MLTHRQRDCLEFVDLYTQATGGISPSFGEIGLHLNLASKSSIARLLRGLEERGYIRRLKSRARSVEVIKRPRQRAAYFIWDEQNEGLIPWESPARQNGSASS